MKQAIDMEDDGGWILCVDFLLHEWAGVPFLEADVESMSSRDIPAFTATGLYCLTRLARYKKSDPDPRSK